MVFFMIETEQFQLCGNDRRTLWKTCGIHDRVVKLIDRERLAQSEQLFSSLPNQILPTKGPAVLIRTALISYNRPPLDSSAAFKMTCPIIWGVYLQLHVLKCNKKVKNTIKVR